MGFASGSCCPFRRSLLPTADPPFLFCSLRNGPARRNNAAIMACNGRDSNSCPRRVVLVMGFAVIQLLKMRAEAIDAPAAENAESRAPKQKQNAVLSVQGSSSQNSFFSLVNAIGFLGSGVLAAFCALTKKEKTASDAIVESMNMKLREKEVAFSSLEKKFEEELLNEEVQRKAVAKANEVQQCLVNQLKLANNTVEGLSLELQKEKRLVEELTFLANDLECYVDDAEEEKRQVLQQLKHKLNSVSLARKDKYDFT